MLLEAEAEKKPCLAPISRLRVEKIEGGLVVAGVVVAANCQFALPIFGCLFVLVGIVLTVASYRGPAQDEEPENYAARLAFTGNSRILGPACIAVGCIMLSAGFFLCHLAKKAQRREKRIGFHCPIHGNFYPLNPKTDSEEIMQPLPQCPHTQMSSTRSSFSGAMSPCPTPMPFLVAANSMGNELVVSVEKKVSPDLTFGSIRSLSVCKEIASFPLSRTPSPPLQERSYSLAEGKMEKYLIKIEDETVENNGFTTRAESEIDYDSDTGSVTLNTNLTWDKKLHLLRTAQGDFQREKGEKKGSKVKTTRKCVSVFVPLQDADKNYSV